MTITKILCGCALVAFAVATTSAQTKNSISGTCAKHQRGLRVAIVRARQLALLPYAAD